MKFFDSELKIMEVLWNHGDLRAKEISDILKEEIGWSMNTTYTVIKKCIKKGAVKRTEPHFQCHAVVSREEAQIAETDELIGRLYGGSVDKLFTALLGSRKLQADEIAHLRRLVDELEEKS